jgi:hypothetical protein
LNEDPFKVLFTDETQKHLFAGDTDSTQRRFLAIHRCPFVLADRLHLVDRAGQAGLRVLEVLGHLVDLGFHSVRGVRRVLVVQKVLLVLGKMLSGFRLVLAGLAVLEIRAVHRFLERRLVQVVLVVLGRLLVLGLLAGRLGLVVQRFRPVLVVLGVQLGIFGRKCLVVGMEQQLRLELRHFLGRLVGQAGRAGLLVLVVLVVQVGSSELSGCIDSGLASRRSLDASDGRCC